MVSKAAAARFAFFEWEPFEPTWDYGEREGMRLLMRSEDMETGEACLDRETGEEVAVAALLRGLPERRAPPQPPPPPPTDAETGEPEGPASPAKKRPFQIPKDALDPARRPAAAARPTDPDRVDHYTPGLPHPAVDPRLLPGGAPPSKLPPMNCLQKKMERSTNMSPILFMLPTVFLFPAWASVLLIVFELICHAYVHKKNRMLPRSSKIVYQSPLHLITSVFCAYCQSENSMIKIGKLQDERLLRAHRKELAYCSYVERMSVVT